MNRRIDWINDPNAPPANSVVPSANVIVANEANEILMIRRTDNGNYALPGGAMELGESIKDTAIREAKEETGYDVEITGIVGIYSDPGHVIEYTSNGEVRQTFTVVFTATATGGKPTTNPEASQVLWIKPADLDDYTTTDSVKQRIAHYLTPDQWPIIT